MLISALVWKFSTFMWYVWFIFLLIASATAFRKLSISSFCFETKVNVSAEPDTIFPQYTVTFLGLYLSLVKSAMMNTKAINAVIATIHAHGVSNSATAADITAARATHAKKIQTPLAL